MPPTPSPYDFNTPIQKTSAELSLKVVEKINEYKDVLIFEEKAEMSAEEKRVFEEKSTDFAIEVMKLISESDLPMDYCTHPIDKIIVVLNTLKGFIGGTVRQYETEFMSRALEVKSPENGKYRKEQATVGQLLLKLNEVREKQGNNEEDYFNKTAQLSTTDEKDVADEDAG